MKRKNENDYVNWNRDLFNFEFHFDSNNLVAPTWDRITTESTINTSLNSSTNIPNILLSQPLYTETIQLKSVEVPISWYNIKVDNAIGIEFVRRDGTKLEPIHYRMKAGSYYNPTSPWIRQSPIGEVNDLDKNQPQFVASSNYVHWFGESLPIPGQGATVDAMTVIFTKLNKVIWLNLSPNDMIPDLAPADPVIYSQYLLTGDADGIEMSLNTLPNGIQLKTNNQNTVLPNSLNYYDLGQDPYMYIYFTEDHRAMLNLPKSIDSEIGPKFAGLKYVTKYKFFQNLFDWTDGGNANVKKPPSNNFNPFSNYLVSGTENAVLPLFQLQSIPRYIFLRSSITRGSSTNALVTYANRATTSNILAKIPIYSNSITFGEPFKYTAVDSMSDLNLTHYNGTYIQDFKIWFTNEFNEEPIDFNGYSFSGSINMTGYIQQS